MVARIGMVAAALLVAAPVFAQTGQSSAGAAATVPAVPEAPPGARRPMPGTRPMAAIRPSGNTAEEDARERRRRATERRVTRGICTGC